MLINAKRDRLFSKFICPIAFYSLIRIPIYGENLAFTFYVIECPLQIRIFNSRLLF